jgi:hypothetical protein
MRVVGSIGFWDMTIQIRRAIEDAVNRRQQNMKSCLVGIILLTLPFYCLGGFLLLTAPNNRQVAGNPSPTGDVISNTQIAQIATRTIPPSITPFVAGTLRPTPTTISLNVTQEGFVPPITINIGDSSTPGVILLPPIDTGGGTGGNTGGGFGAGGNNSPLCPDFFGTTNEAIRANIPGGTAPGANVYCKLITNPYEIGIQSVIDRGVITAVDISALAGGGSSVTRFNNPIEVCLSGSGAFLFLDANNSPRYAQQLDAYDSGGYTCASVPNAGTVVLVRS